MSLAREDWKWFDVLSGQLKIGDAMNRDGVLCNAESGSWVAMCEYDDDNRISYVVAMRDFLANSMRNGKVEIEGVAESDSFVSKSGTIFIIDRKAEGNLPKSFKVPDHRLNDELVKHFGKPDDDGKSQSDRFIECCFHLAKDGPMPSLESLDFGAVFELSRGEVYVDMLYNRVRDVIGFEIGRKD